MKQPVAKHLLWNGNAVNLLLEAGSAGYPDGLS